MRILFVTRGLPFHSVGGMEAVSWDLAKCFAGLSHEVAVLTTRASSLDADSVVDGVRIRCVDAPTGRYSRAWWRQSRVVYEKEFADWADIVLSVSAGAMAIVKNRNRLGPRFFVQAHGTAWGEAVSKMRVPGLWSKLTVMKSIHAMIKDRAFRSFDGFIAVGESVQRDLMTAPTRWIIGGMPVACVPNGVAPKVFAFDKLGREQLRQSLGIPLDARVGLIASRLHAQKGVIEGVRGFAELRRKPHPEADFLLIAGGGPDRTRIDVEVSRLGLGDAVMMLGRIERIEMATVLSAADYFLFPTLRVEGLAMNVLEARANGLPVVLSRNVDHPDFGSKAVNPLRPEEIAVAISEISITEDRGSRLPEKYTLSASAKRYISIFADTDQTGAGL